MNDAKVLKEEDLEKIDGGSYWVNGVEYQCCFRAGRDYCPNCSCNGATYFYTNEHLSLYECKTGVYKCGFCGHVWPR